MQKKIIGSNELEKLKKTRVYIVDELDGSSSFNAGHYEWAISVGCVENLAHTAGAVFAPKIENGTLFFASRGKGAFVETGKKRKKLHVANNDLKNAYVLAGTDCVLTKYPVHNNMLTKLGNITRTMNINGSCALALGLVAAGRADALIQPVNSPWDWAAGKIILEEAGGIMIFYEMERGRIIPIKKLQPKHYSPEKRMVGFVAGSREIAKDIMHIMLELNV